MAAWPRNSSDLIAKVQEVSDSPLASKTATDLTSAEAARMFRWINPIICLLINVFGVMTNIVNITCFVKQGFQEPINVSFLGLSISDFGGVLTLIWSSLCLNPSFQESFVTFDTIETSYLISSIPHVTFSRVTGWITVLVTLERCLCITMPLKVKTMMTSKRIIIIVVCIYIVSICGIIPVYYANRFGMKFFPERNRTMLGLVYTDDQKLIDGIALAINNVVLPFISYLVVVVLTITLVIEMKSKAKWRRKCTTSSQADITADREQKVAKMVVGISALFIGCFTPTCIIFIIMIVVPGASIDGEHKDLMFTLGGVSVFLESVNSSLNILIYHHMSSRYRAIFRQVFLRRNKPTG